MDTDNQPNFTIFFFTLTEKKGDTIIGVWFFFFFKDNWSLIGR